MRGRTPEKIALEWWKQIQKEMSCHAELEKIIAYGDHDITQRVLELKEEEWKKLNDDMDKLPF